MTPNRVTIAGHRFDVEDMSGELQTEIFEVLFNRTRLEDLSRGSLDFEIKGE